MFFSNNTSRAGFQRPCSVVAVFKNIAGLAVKRFADGGKRRKPHRFCLAGFENGQICRRKTGLICKLSQCYPALCHHIIQFYRNLHVATILYSQFVFAVYFDSVCKHILYNAQYNAHEQHRKADYEHRKINNTCEKRHKRYIRTAPR